MSYWNLKEDVKHESEAGEALDHTNLLKLK